MSKISAHVSFCVAPLILLTAAIGLIKNQEPFVTWFFCFAWWSYIVFLESWLHLNGESSPLFQTPGAFIGTAAASILIWLVFELYNFRLQNWHYVDLPPSLAVRWFGYGLSFATVLPGLSATYRALEHLRLVKSKPHRPLTKPTRLYIPFYILGVFCLVSPLIWPAKAFPLIWLGFVFFLEPIAHKNRLPCLLADIQRGSSTRLKNVLLAGLICGFFWELWNYWAGSKWVYTIPYFSRPKLFEMPLLGFLGFPPFALECFLMYQCGLLFWLRLAQEAEQDRLRLLRKCSLVAMVLFILLAFAGIDHFTVTTYLRSP